MKLLFKVSAQAVIAATLTLCLADSSFAQRRGEVRRGETRREARRNDRYEPYQPPVSRHETRRDRWNREQGRFNGNRWHYDHGITIRNYGRRYDFDRSLTFDFYLRQQRLRHNIQLLGATSLTQYTTDFDKIYTGGCGFQALQIRVVGNDANIDHLMVELDNGELDYIDVNAYFQNGAWSYWLDLNGFRRCVRSVVVVGQTVGYQYDYGYGYSYQAQVEIYGRY